MYARFWDKDERAHVTVHGVLEVTGNITCYKVVVKQRSRDPTTATFPRPRYCLRSVVR